MRKTNSEGGQDSCGLVELVCLQITVWLEEKVGVFELRCFIELYLLFKLKFAYDVLVNSSNYPYL